MIRRELARNSALSFLALLAGLAAVWAILRLAAWGMGIRDRDLRYPNQIDMWRPDSIAGYANKRDFRSLSFGTVRIVTNEHGFRGARPTPLEGGGKLRIFGVGDSVMWGTGLEEEDTFLGVLERLLAESGTEAEVVNAGVGGFSTVQEYLFFESVVLPFRPDIVLLGLCFNDLLPTEDPHGTVRAVYTRYLNALLERPDNGLSAVEKQVASRFLETLATADHVWSAVRPFALSPLEHAALSKALIEYPLSAMGSRCRAEGIRLIGLVFPTKERMPMFERYNEIFRRALEREGIEFLDFSSVLRGEGDEPKTLDGQEGVYERFVREKLRRTPFRDLDNILWVRRFSRLNETELFLDSAHPSKKGSRLVAERIHAVLSADGGSAARTLFGGSAGETRGVDAQPPGLASMRADRRSTRGTSSRTASR